MIRLGIKCILQSDLVLSSSPANEGFYQSLDYIPGSKFLGILAKEIYDMSPQIASQTLDIFHYGKVRFGDAHLLIDEQLSYKAPLNWIYPKKSRDFDEIKLFHKFDPSIKIEDLDIYESVKDKYFTLDRKITKVDQNFSIKSAYDRENYRSMDKQMYGYFALPKGSEWVGYIDFDDDSYIQIIKEHLLGRKRMGRSKSSQYGLVIIEEFNRDISFDQSTAQSGEAYLYAYSNLCFVDQNGNYTTRPSLKDLKLPKDSTILWEKSKIKTRKYQTWNKKRHQPNQDRFIIEKGSVFVVQLKESLSYEEYKMGIGSHRSEGFGQVLLNPSFLMPQIRSTEDQNNKDNSALGWKFQKPGKESTLVESPILNPNDHPLLAFIEQKKKSLNSENKMDKWINEFISENENEFKNINSSQWGQIRNISKNIEKPELLDFLLFDEKIGFVHSGQAKSQWNTKKEQLLKHSLAIIPPYDRVSYLAKLASLMAQLKGDN